MSSDDDYPLFESSRTMTVRRRPLFIIGFVVAVIIVVLLATTVYFAQKSNKNGATPPAPHTDTGTSSLPCPLTYFNKTDGANIRWYPDASSAASLKEALAGNYHMIGAYVTVSKTGGPVIGETKFEAWLDQVLAKKVGIKLTFTNDSVVEKTLMVLKQKRPLKRPVYLSAKVLSVADTNRTYVNRTKFFNAVKALLPEVRLSIGIDPGSSQQFTSGDIETFNGIIKPLKQSVSLEMDPALVKQSWSVLRPWIASSKNNDVIMTQSPGTVSNLSEFDLLLIRNDCDGDKVYYNMKGDTFDKFLSLMVTAESPMLSFGVTPRDASKIIWKHAVNSKAKLDKALNDSAVMMLEADIVMGNETGTNNTNIPIMAHPPNKTSDLTFANFLNRVIPSKKGIKLDFKELEPIPPVLNMTNKLKGNITVPVWLNADVLKGPNGKNVTMTASVFLDDVKAFPAAILSLGWTTGNKTATLTKYTMDMVKEMHDLCKNLSQPVTFPVRADRAKDSLASLNWLLQQSRGYSLTIWTTPYDNVTKAEMNYVQRNTEAARVYFDLPNNLMPDIYN